MLILFNISFLASVLDRLDLTHQVTELRDNALGKCTHLLGLEHPETLIAMSDIVLHRAQAGRPAETYDLARKAVELYSKIEENGSTRTFQDMRNLMNTLSIPTALLSREEFARRGTQSLEVSMKRSIQERSNV